MREIRPVAAAGVAFLIMLLAAGCAVGPGPTVSIQDAMARPAPVAGGTGGAFMTIVNRSTLPDRLLAASSPAAAAVELHETVDDGGVMRMVPHPEGWEIAARGRLELKPGGKHLMLIGLKEPLEAGQTVVITLTFQNAGAVTVQVPVKAMAQ